MSSKFQGLQSFQALYETLACDDGMFGFGGKQPVDMGISRSPMHPVQQSVYYGNPAEYMPTSYPQAMVMYSPQYYNPGSVSPMMQRGQVTPTVHRTPIAYHPPPFNPYAAQAPPPLPYQQTAQTYQPYRVPPASRSQPAPFRRSVSSDGSSSDSDAAAEINRFIHQTDDPRKLQKRIDRSVRKNKRSHKHRREIPNYPTSLSPDHSRDLSLPPLYAEFEELLSERPQSDTRARKRYTEDKRVKTTKSRRSRSPKKGSRKAPAPEIIPVDIVPYAPSDANESWFDVVENPEERISYLPPIQEDTRLRFNKNERKSSHRQRREKTQKPVSHRRRSQSESALVPMRPAPRKIHRHLQSDIGEKIVTWWSPERMVTGKRQRLPPLDWRKGEKYNRAPDGTIIGKEGFTKLIFDDSIYDKRPASRKNIEQRDTSVIRKPIKEKKRRPPVIDESEETILALQPAPIDDDRVTWEAGPRSQSSAIRPTGLKKNSQGIYTRKNKQILHRKIDRVWGDKNDVSGFMMSGSIMTDSAFMSQVCLFPGMPEGNLDTVLPDQTLFMQVIMASEPNSIRVLINGEEEILNEGDVLYADPNSTYSVTNTSHRSRAILLVVMSQ